MDEGFTSYATARVQSFYYEKRLEHEHNNAALKDLVEKRLEQLPLDHSDAYNGYYSLVRSGLEEPLTTHADHFSTNFAYSIASYSKGEIFLEQLGYIVGAETMDKILLEYYREWRVTKIQIAAFLCVLGTA